ncbi:fluoride efflux transporter CrcB [Dysgonomonas sp. 25]|uniref:fluoride efflux transporter CrcB n=1 Tax=Dysgonomonas sp. 25 TaxID=2302933 RepID=UPI0021041E10|nr:fluoride efflux transporter CrcB [Dysgonomonas sp. 25]
MITFISQITGTMAIKILLVGLGGGLGSILRFLTSTYINRWYIQAFPMGTFVVNIVGCFLIGLLMAMAGKYLNEDLRLLLITGFCGGYTTFSTFSAENMFLLQNGNYATLGLYILASVAVGLLAVWLGDALVNWIYE